MLLLNETTLDQGAGDGGRVHWLGWGPMTPLLGIGERLPHEGATDFPAVHG